MYLDKGLLGYQSKGTVQLFHLFLIFFSEKKNYKKIYKRNSGKRISHGRNIITGTF